MPRKKFRVVERRDDATRYRCVDEDGTEELIVYKDPAITPLRKLLGSLDLDAIAAAWEADSPANKMLIPDDTGGKVWTSLEPEAEAEPVKSRTIPAEFAGRSRPEPVVEQAPEPVKKKRRKRTEPAPQPETAPAPVVSREVETAARALATQVRQSVVKRRSDYLPVGIPPANAEAWIAHALAQGWITVDGDLLRRGPVPLDGVEATMDAGRSDGWTHRLLTRR